MGRLVRMRGGGGSDDRPVAGSVLTPLTTDNGTGQPLLKSRSSLQNRQRWGAGGRGDGRVEFGQLGGGGRCHQEKVSFAKEKEK